jgi:hypothetical protein
MYSGGAEALKKGKKGRELKRDFYFKAYHFYGVSENRVRARP